MPKASIDIAYRWYKRWPIEVIGRIEREADTRGVDHDIPNADCTMCVRRKLFAPSREKLITYSSGSRRSFALASGDSPITGTVVIAICSLIFPDLSSSKIILAERRCFGSGSSPIASLSVIEVVIRACDVTRRTVEKSFE